MKNSLKPILKWTGGKRREIKHFEKYFPTFERFFEPFVGGGAVYWHLNHSNSIINDYDKGLINFYKMLKTNSAHIQTEVKQASLFNKNYEKMKSLYYEHRDIMDNDQCSDLDRAFSFLYVNKLCFSGMRRFNSQGKFNVPFGHYKTFNPAITDEHIKLLNNTIIHNEDALQLIPQYDNEGVFIFLDPPYTRVFKEYSPNNNFAETEQKLLSQKLNALQNAKWMLVINDSEEIRDLYKDCYFKEYSLKYGINVKNRFDTKVTHLIISNYEMKN